MTPENFERTLRAFQKRSPYLSSTVELVSGSNFQVHHPEALVFRDGLAVFIVPGGCTVIFDHEGVSQIVGEPRQKSA